MNFEYLEETIIDQIEILTEELGGKNVKINTSRLHWKKK